MMSFIALFIALTGCPNKETQPSAENPEKAEHKPDPNCSLCHGTGTIAVKVKKECTTCEGTGKVLGDKCQTCHGSGEMEVAEEQNCPKCNPDK